MKITLHHVLDAYDHANDCKYLRGTTNWCAAVAWYLNERLKEQLNEAFRN